MYASTPSHAAGVVSDEELLSLRKFGSRLQGHPNPRVLPYVDVATGSLGQGLPIGVGMALCGKSLEKLPFRVWVVLGDSEVAEGSIWEAFDKGAYYKLDNLTVILDMNRLGQRGPTELGSATGVVFEMSFSKKEIDSMILNLIRRLRRDRPVGRSGVLR